ncbi:hypothetical protein V495_01403 [Pseudogymnoascus sp. VKM F-4514 (FW-929)]|nr:hypothetical protein V495_01403 [Pseudogymnoascus sp. VKM F-4514 (FW-929)]KFY56393.1 hypothetical protein V497_06317 [Pseudogymnoascus sp. VKM F-4516 (FW-969)]
MIFPKPLAGGALLLLAAESSDAAAVKARASAGCGIVRDYKGQTHTGQTIVSGGITRTYDVYLPPNYDENKATPLIISFHGNTRDSTNQRGLDHFDNNDWNPDHLVVWPNGVKGHWQGPTYADPSVSDKKFTGDLIDHLRDAFCIDDSRIYAAGKSNGGGFTGTLACSPEFGQNFAAIAACSGAFYTDVVEDPNDSCHPSRSPFPILEFHGSADETIPYIPTEDGSGGPLPTIPDWLSTWGQRNGCPADYKPVVSQLNGDPTVQKTLWPSTTPNSDQEAHGDKPVSIDATPMILEFFRSIKKP